MISYLGILQGSEAWAVPVDSFLPCLFYISQNCKLESNNQTSLIK